MGTFTKSFGAAGGYIAGNKSLIDALRLRSHSGPFAETMTPPVLTQVVASMGSIMGVAQPVSPAMSNNSVTTIKAISNNAFEHLDPAPAHALPPWLNLHSSLRDGAEGRERLRRLAFNSRYLHRGLDKLGFITYGHADSPIVPLLIFNPGKMMVFHRLMKLYAVPIVVVVVAYPATPLITTRVRFCVSAAHTKEDIDTILKACDEIGDVLDLKHGKGERWKLEKIMDSAVELVNH
jgi:serine palmitoyltransferase